MKLQPAIALILFSFVACTKARVNNNKVLIRIANSTTENFSSLVLNTTEFKQVSSGDTSSYQ
ncbi:MAG: hypothetical protein ACRDE5_16325, partial [Ginsengibacter sp.]